MRTFINTAIAYALLTVSLSSSWAQAEDETVVSVQQKIKAACPKQWEDVFSDIKLNPSVLDIWQGDLLDKAQFVQYANQFLLDENGQLLIDSYHDTITIMTECGAQRVKLYKMIRAHIGHTINQLATQLDGYTVFRNSSLASGLSYQDWVDDTTIVNDATPDQPKNLALGKYTTQSGTSNDVLASEEAADLTEDEIQQESERQGYAVKAVDGDRNGDFANKSVTHTGFQNQPYWQLDLDQISQINDIVIYNRTDCCTNRLANFSVLLSDNNINKRKLSDAKALDGVTVIDIEQIEGESVRVPLPDNAQARYIRIQLSANNTVLSLAEVEVIGLPIADDMM